MTKVLEEKLNRVIERLRPYKPEKIILYGSHARGDTGKYSDIDLLIVKKTKKPYFERRRDASKFLYKKEYFFSPNEYIYGLDFMIFTPQEVEGALKKGDFFFKEIFNEGKLIYERV